MGRILLTTLVIFASLWLIMPVYAQSAISLDLEPLPTAAVSEDENRADWRKGLEILQGVTLKERGAEFHYDCRGRWDSDQLCKYMWAATNDWEKSRFGRSLKFAAAGLAINPRARQLLNRVGKLLVTHCAEALPFIERGVDPNGTYLGGLTHCRDQLSVTSSEVRRARRLFWVSGHLDIDPTWERQRIALTYYDAWSLKPVTLWGRRARLLRLATYMTERGTAEKHVSLQPKRPKGS